MRTNIRRPSREAAFRHDALFYSGTDGFVARTSAFIRDSVADGEPILVVVSDEKIELLRRELGGDPGWCAVRRHAADRSQPGPDHPRVA